MSRDSASSLISANAAKYAHGIDPQDLVAVRYSSDPKNHFVITTRPPALGKVEHFPVVNSPLGYAIAGETQDFQPTLLDCVQRHVLDRLFAKAMNTTVALSRDNQEQWYIIFAAVQAELPADYYPSIEALDAAAEQLDLGDRLGAKPKNSATFHSLMGISALPASAYCPPGGPPAAQQSHVQPRQCVQHNSSQHSQQQQQQQQSSQYDDIASYSRTAAASYAAKSAHNSVHLGNSSGAMPVLRSHGAQEQSAEHKLLIGQYMVREGLALLLQAGRLSEQQASLIRDLI